MPVILATQEAEIRRIAVRSQPGQIIRKTLSQKALHKSRVVEWLKVNSSPSTAKKKKKKKF
jgi:predicted XRE-type DNA-binding protein